MLRLGGKLLWHGFVIMKISVVGQTGCGADVGWGVS